MQSISRLVVIAGLPVLFFGAASRGLAQEESAGWEKYDFIAGEHVIYFEDFTALLAASVMNRLADVKPGASIDPRQGVPFLRVHPPGGYVAALPEELPEHFTIDFDLSVDADNGNGVRIKVLDGGISNPSVFECSQRSVAVVNSQGGGKSVEVHRLLGFDDLGQRTFHCALTVDGSRARAYVDKLQALDIPNANFGRSGKVQIEVTRGSGAVVADSSDSSEAPAIPDAAWLTNVRIATGVSPVSYDDLNRTGRVVTHGILFVVGSALIRPESTPTLRRVGDMLKAHGDLSLGIEAYTDNVGPLNDTRILAKRRATAVALWLVKNYGIKSSRLIPSGPGATKPLAPNRAPIGRLQNRRIELVKQ